MGSKKTVKDLEKLEEEYYPLVLEVVRDGFRLSGHSTDFDLTGHPKGKSIPERFLKEPSLKKYSKLPTPDIMGWVWRGSEENKKLVIVEFKLSPKFEDIFQTKGYGELFNSDWTFLLSYKPFYESSGKVLDYAITNPELLKIHHCDSRKTCINVRILHATPEGKITTGRLGTDLDSFPTDCPYL